MENKKWLRSVAFVLLLVIALVGVMQCYGLPRNYDTRNMEALDAEKRNTLDGIILGTSVVSYSWNTPAAWRDYGMAIYHMATSEQPFAVIPEYVDFISKKHDIKYVIVDVHGLRSKTVISSLKESTVRSAYLNFPKLFPRFDILSSIFDYAEKAYAFYGEPTVDRDKYVDVNDKSYYLPLYSFHSRWVDGLQKADFVTVKNNYLGADVRKNKFKIMDCTEYLDRWDFDDPGEVDAFQKEQLDNLFEYGKEKDINFIFISLPSFRSKEEQMELSAILDYCDENGYDTIDFTSDGVLEDAGIDVSTDFVDKGHLNSRGGIKSTKYVCEFIKEKGYDTPDHRGDKKYSSWDEATEAYFKYYEKGWSNSK